MTAAERIELIRVLNEAMRLAMGRYDYKTAELLAQKTQELIQSV